MKELVLFHGFLGGPDHFDDVVHRLPAALRVHRPTLPGHGPDGARSAKGDFSQATAALAAVVPRGAVLAGYSLGARLALAVAANHPELELAALVLLSGSAGLVSEADRAARRAVDEERARRVERDGIIAFADAWGDEPIVSLRTTDHTVRARRAAARRRHTEVGIAWSLRALGLGSMPPLSRALGTLSRALPIHFVVGEHDAKYRALVSALTAELSVSVHVMPGAGHDVVLDSPAVLATTLRAVCGDLAAPPSKDTSP